MRLCRILVGLAVALAVCVPGAEAAPVAKPAKPAISFEPNQGQADPAVKFLARGQGFGLFLTQTETVLVLAHATKVDRTVASGDGETPSVVRMRLVGADSTAAVTGVDPLPGRSHSFVGTPDRWRRDVPTFARVRYADVYPGVSVVFYGNEGQLEYDFVVAPGADPDAVVMAFDGARGLHLDGDGDLRIVTDKGELRLRRPLIYQEEGTARRPLEGGYVLDGDRVSFRVAGRDPARPLVIDPTLGYSSLLNGSSNDQGFALAVDGAGSVYVTGTTISSDFPVTPVAVQTTRAGDSDAFVTKLDPTGLFIVYSTFLGGSGDDAGRGIAVDADGSAYVAGTTNSNNFPTTPLSFQPTTRGGDEAFVARLGPDGSALVYSTYLGSNGRDGAFGIAIDTDGNAFVTGFTTAPTFPNNNAIPCFGTKSTGSDVFVVRVNPGGATLGSCTFIGGAGEDVGNAIALDPSGNIWVAGTTTSLDLPLVLGIGLQQFLGGGQDALIAKLSPAGVLLVLTYFGGTRNEEGLAIAVDSDGNVYVAGSTQSPDLPTSHALQPFLNGRTNAFVVKLSPDGNSTPFATFLGGSGDDRANAVAVHPTDFTVYLAGSTNSVDFPVVAPIQAQLAGAFDVFVTKLSAAGNAIVYSTYLGGTNDEEARAIAVDSNGIAYVAGSTRSVAFPAQRLVGTGGLLDVFVTQITDAPIIQFTSSTFQVRETAGSATVTVQRIGDTSHDATVHIATSNGTATAGSDFGTVNVSTPPSGTLGFGPGQIVASFTIPILNNETVCEGDETVNLTLTNPSFGNVLGSRNTSTLTILDTASCISFVTPTYTVTENHGPALIAITRSGPLTGTASVQLVTSNGTAIAGTDYGTKGAPTFPPVRVTFPAGVRTVNASIPIIDNQNLDGTRTVNLALSDPTNAQLVTGRAAAVSAVLSILDDDVGGTVQFAASLTTVSESVGTATVMVTRTGSTAGGATVGFFTTNGTAIAGTDFAPPAPSTLTFPAGKTSMPISIPIISPGGGGVRSLTLTLNNPGTGTVLGTRKTTTLRIVDNDVSLAIASQAYSVKESAGVVTIAVELTGINATPVTVNWAASDETANAGTDYGTPTLSGGSTPPPPSGVLTFPPGGSVGSVRTKTFSIRILQDQVLEDTETFRVTLSAPSPGAQLVAGRDFTVVSILDDEIGGTIQFSAATYTASEGVGDAVITLTRTGGLGGGATVHYATGGGTAKAGTDYGTPGDPPPSGTATFLAGHASTTFLVPIIDTTTPDGVHTVNLTLSNPGPNATTKLGARTAAVLRIIDNEVSLAIASQAYSVKESAGVVTIAVELTGVNATPVTVHWEASDGTASAGTDYGTPTPPGGPTPPPPSGDLTFPQGGSAGSVRTKTFSVRILQDQVVENTETFRVTLSAPSPGAQLVAGRDFTDVSIVNDDVAGTIQFSTLAFNAIECPVLTCNATLTVSRTGGLAKDVTVDFATADGTAAAGTDFGTLGDANPVTGTVTFGAGQVTQTIRIPLLGELGSEPTKSFTVLLSNPGSGGALGARTSATVNIIDTR